MSKALAIFGDTGKLALPSHIANFFDEEGGNIADRVTVPSLSYEGKTWTIVMNGEKTKMMKKDDDGDEIPISTMNVIVLDYAKRRGRAYYEGGYDPAKPGMPVCWSDDGVAPDPKITDPQAKKCETCPLAVKGSKTTEQGKAVTACSQHRMLAVVPANKLDFTPLRMKIAITSDWDKNEELAAQGWFGFQNYTDFLRTRGIQHTAALVTKMKMDPDVAYPKIIFNPSRLLTAEELAIIAPVTKSDDVKKLIVGTWTVNGVDGVKRDEAVPVADDEDEEAEKAKVAAAKKAAAKKAAPVADDDDDEVVEPPKKVAKKAAPVDDDDEDEAAAAKVAAATKKAAKKAAVVEAEPEKPKKAKATIVMDDDDEDGPALPVSKKTAASGEGATKPKAAAKSGDAELPGDVKALLDEWGDD